MREKDWIVTIRIQYDDENTTLVRYGVQALTSEMALVRAGMRLALKMRGAIVVDATIEEEQGSTRARTIEMKPTVGDARATET